MLEGQNPTIFEQSVKFHDGLTYHLYLCIQHFSKKVLHSRISLLTERQFTDNIKSGRRVYDTPIKFWQRRILLDLVDESMEIRVDDPNCASSYLVKFLICSKNIVLKRLKKNKRSTWISHYLSSSHERERQRIASFCLACLFIDDIMTGGEKWCLSNKYGKSGLR